MKVAAQLKQFQQGVWKAVRSGDRNELKIFLRRPGFNHMQRGTFGETILHVALLYNHTECAKLLIDLYPSLIEAIYKHEQFKGETAVHIAVVNQNMEALQYLVKAKASINGCHAVGNFFLRDGGTVYYGETPLHFAVCTGQADMVRYLVDEGADVGAVDMNENNIFHLCVLHELEDIYQSCWELSEQIFGSEKTAAMCNTRNSEMMTPIQLAALHGSRKMVGFLIERSRIVGWVWGFVALDAYPIRELDIDEGKDGVVYTCVKCGHSHILDIPIIHEILQAKWVNYCGYIFFIYGAIMFAYCATLTYAFVVSDFKVPLSEDDTAPLWWAILTLSSIMLLVRITDEIHQYFIHGEGISLLEAHRNVNTPDVPLYFANILFISNIFIVIGVVLHYLNRQDIHCLVTLSIALLGHMFYFLKFPMVLSAGIGKFVVAIFYIIRENVLNFIFIYLLLIIALSAPMSRFYGSEDYNIWISELIFISLGFDPEFSEDPDHRIAFFGVRMIFGVLHIVVLLNLLIAVMTETIDKVSKRAGIIFRQTRADVIFEMEQLCPWWFYKPVGILATEAGIPSKDETLRVIPRLKVTSVAKAKAKTEEQLKKALVPATSRSPSSTKAVPEWKMVEHLKNMESYLKSFGYTVTPPVERKKNSERKAMVRGKLARPTLERDGGFGRMIYDDNASGDVKLRRELSRTAPQVLEDEDYVGDSNDHISVLRGCGSLDQSSSNNIHFAVPRNNDSKRQQLQQQTPRRPSPCTTESTHTRNVIRPTSPPSARMGKVNINVADVKSPDENLQAARGDSDPHAANPASAAAAPATAAVNFGGNQHASDRKKILVTTVTSSDRASKHPPTRTITGSSSAMLSTPVTDQEPGTAASTVDLSNEVVHKLDKLSKLE